MSFEYGMDVDTLFSFNVIVFANNEPDIQVFELHHDYEVGPFLYDHLGDGYIQTIINNLDPDTRAFCPFFRVCMSDFGGTTSTNYKLKSFYNQIGMSTLDNRCSKAVVVGLSTLHHMESPLSVPYSFCTTKIDPIYLHYEQNLDLSCLQPCVSEQKPVGATLCDIAGLCLPCHIPDEVHFHILKYLTSPTADIIKNAKSHVGYCWNVNLYTMFYQREPRIPVHIASFYNAATVQRTADVAVRPILAPIATDQRSVNPSLRSS